MTQATQSSAAAKLLAPPAMLRGQKLQLMLAQVGARGAAQAAAGLLPLLSFEAGDWQQLQALQRAVLQRLQQQQQAWFWGLLSLGQDYGELKQANTLSKYMVQEYDMLAQFGALLNAQGSEWVNLLENLQVDYGYWMAQRQERLRS